MYLVVSESMMTNVTMPIRIVATRIFPHGHFRLEGVASSLLLVFSAVE